MFNNTVTLATESTGSNTIVLPLVDGPTNQRTLRSADLGSGVTAEFSIAHQSTTENKGNDTIRTVVRLAKTKVDADTGIPVTAYVQLIVSVPHSFFTSADVAISLAQLVSFLFTEGDAENLEDIPFAVSGVSPTTARLYAGEP
jgi:hypothetical protein